MCSCTIWLLSIEYSEYYYFFGLKLYFVLNTEALKGKTEIGSKATYVCLVESKEAKMAFIISLWLWSYGIKVVDGSHL